jgi:hypothetical protein
LPFYLCPESEHWLDWFHGQRTSNTL